MSDHGYAEMLFELGAAKLTRKEAQALMDKAERIAGSKHAMGATAHVQIPHTDKMITYCMGIDGLDYTWKVEPIPVIKTQEALVAEAVTIFKNILSESHKVHSDRLQEWVEAAQLRSFKLDG